MNPRFYHETNWLNKNYKWLVPVTTVLVPLIYLILSSGLGKISTDLVQAYADKELYHKAIEKAIFFAEDL